MVSVAKVDWSSIIPVTIVSLSASKFSASAPAMCEKMSKSAFSPFPLIISFINNVALPVSLSIIPCINCIDWFEFEFIIISDIRLKSSPDSLTKYSNLVSLKFISSALYASISFASAIPSPLASGIVPKASCFEIARSIFSSLCVAEFTAISFTLVLICSVSSSLRVVFWISLFSERLIPADGSVKVVVLPSTVISNVPTFPIESSTRDICLFSFELEPVTNVPLRLTSISEILIFIIPLSFLAIVPDSNVNLPLVIR